jgi:thiol-disulfide isomerase/thioredoxin
MSTVPPRTDARLPLRRSRENAHSSMDAAAAKPPACDAASARVVAACDAPSANDVRCRAIVSDDELQHTLSNAAESAPTGWLAVLLHAPWAWPNVDAARGLRASARDGFASDAGVSVPMSWRWLLATSRVPIVTVDVARVPTAAAQLGVRTKTLPLVCVMRAGQSPPAAPTKALVSAYEKPVRTVADVASHTLLEPAPTAAALEAVIAREAAAGAQLVVAYVGAAWCAPCCRILPHLPRLAHEMPTMRVVKVDYDAGGQLAQAIGVEKIPTFAAFAMHGEPERGPGGTRLPFGALQHSDVVKVADAMTKWCELTAARQQALTGDLFTSTDDF